MHTFNALGKSGKVVTVETRGWEKHRKKILIVDDEPDLRKTLGRRLEANGFDVVTASCGESGLQEARCQDPDLIILDVAMPGMDGGEVAQAIREDHRFKDTPIMFLSCLIPRTSDGEIGGNLYMSKPYDPDRLLSKIHEIIH